MSLGETLGLSIGSSVTGATRPGSHFVNSGVPKSTIAIFRIGSLGDTVVALPCFHQIARVFPNSRRIVITDVPASQKAASVETILAKSGLVDDFIPFPPSPRKIRDFLELRKKIQSTNAKL